MPRERIVPDFNSEEYQAYKAKCQGLTEKQIRSGFRAELTDLRDTRWVKPSPDGVKSIVGRARDTSPIPQSKRQLLEALGGD